MLKYFVLTVATFVVTLSALSGLSFAQTQTQTPTPTQTQTPTGAPETGMGYGR